MAVTYNKIAAQVLQYLGAIDGSTPALADANYAATMSTSTVNTSDFPPKAVEDAIIAAMTAIVTAIAETPNHPERIDFFDPSTALSSGDSLPTTGAGGSPVIGLPGAVYDGTSGALCLPVSSDRVRDYLAHSGVGGIYENAEFHWYSIVGAQIFHTRTAVKIGLCVWARPTYTAAGNIPVRDHHEGAIAAGAAAILAAREAMYQEVVALVTPLFESHLAAIRGYAHPDAMTEAQHLPRSA